METALILSQTLFYFVVSIAIIAIGVSLFIALYNLVCITKELRAITHEMHNLTVDARERIGEIIEQLAALPILSFLLKRKQNLTVESKRDHKKS